MYDETYAIAAVVILAAFVLIVAAIAIRGRRKRCARCGARLPRGVDRCPACESEALRPEPPASTASPATPHLLVVQGHPSQKRYTIPDQGLSIGRHPDNDLQLADELMVSRHHAVIAWEQGQCVLYDRDSANGTWVNGRRIFRHVLQPGDQIQIWQSQFVYATTDTPPPTPTPEIAEQPTIHVEGEQFCGYHLEHLIGRGGMSEVFKARDKDGREVAIKILQQSDPYLVAKFVQEGNKIGPLLRGHNNIIYVHEFGTSPDGRLYIVMEYLDAPSLRKSIRNHRSEEETIKIVGQVCSALAFAHQNDVVHRDIKPENILVTTEGAVKVLDFGIAKLTSASTVTRDKIVGTPEYISPEQARGDPVKPASDVYSLGVVLYEMLAGSVPFPRPAGAEAYKAAIEVVRQHLKEEPEPLRKRNPGAGVSARLERVTMRALKKNLNERYADARVFGRALGYRAKPVERATPTGPLQARLAILQGPRQGQHIQLAGKPVTLGRFELGSTNATISRQHANLSFRGGSYWLEDTSKNGTWVDNIRIYGEVPLKGGTIIVIGENVLRLETSPA